MITGSRSTTLDYSSPERPVQTRVVVVVDEPVDHRLDLVGGHLGGVGIVEPLALERRDPALRRCASESWAAAAMISARSWVVSACGRVEATGGRSTSPSDVPGALDADALDQEPADPSRRLAHRPTLRGSSWIVAQARSRVKP